MSKAPKHHYIPVFYLKQWAGPDDRICEFSKPFDRVKPKRVHPDGTAFVRGLNTIPGLPPEEADYLENKFFQIADDGACRVLRLLVGGSPVEFSIEQRSAWSRFLVSLVTRNPESVAKYLAAGEAVYRAAALRLQADYERHKRPEDPPTYEEYAAKNSPNPAGRAGAHLLQRVTDSALIGNHIIRMRWMVLYDPRPPYPLLTSDRPVVMTNGISKPNSQIILPISPRHVFVATNNVETENYIRGIMHRQQLIQQINERTARQSRKFVYGCDDAQLKFVSKRLGMKWTADPLENLELEIPEV